MIKKKKEGEKTQETRTIMYISSLYIDKTKEERTRRGIMGQLLSSVTHLYYNNPRRIYIPPHKPVRCNCTLVMVNRHGRR